MRRGLFVLIVAVLWGVFSGTRAHGADILRFDLYDVYDRQISSSDYAGMPVLVEFGACWCGGCQQDMAELRQLAARYRSTDLQILHAMAGDNNLATLEFQRHYRLPIVHLLDVNRVFERQYNHNGWPFVLLADRDGRVVFSANNALAKVKSDLFPLMLRLAKPMKTGTVESLDGVPYPASVLERSGEQKKGFVRDIFPSLASSRDGKLYVVFTRLGERRSDILFRVYDGQRWSEDRPVVSSPGDRFDATVLVDGENKVWVAWTGNQGMGKYGVYVAEIRDGRQPGPPVLVGSSKDDAMHGRMAVDRDGRLWVIYYKWQKMNGVSRDKEIYVRRRDGNTWSPEIRVSPEDVSEYEDHTDPVIAAWRDGVVAAWSWDYHNPAGYPSRASSPAIFHRTVDANFKMSPAILLSRTGIDTAPALAVDRARGMWCAWDSIRGRASRKNLYAAFRRNPAEGIKATEVELSTGVINVCTPSVLLSPRNVVSALWSETRSGTSWELKRRRYDDTQDQWAPPETLISEENPRFGSGAFDLQGNLWIAYSRQTSTGREIAVKRVPREH